MSTSVEHLVGRPAGLLLDHVRLVLVGEQERRAVDQVADQLALAERELLARVGDERVAALPALLGVAEHPVGVVGADQDVRRRADLRHDRRELDQPRLAHRARVERGELGAGGVGGADEPGRVVGVGDPHVVAVHAVPLQPRAVVGEVVARAADQHRAEPEPAQAEAHVGGDAAAPDLEVVDQERHRQLVELLDDEGVLELPAEGHQVVGGDGPGDQQGASRFRARRERLGGIATDA